MIKLFLVYISLLSFHPVHVSMTGLYEDDAGLTMSVRMYTDDLWLDMYRLYDADGEYNELNHMFVFTGSDSLYQKYIDDHLNVTVNGRYLEKVLTDKEMTDQEIILKFSLDYAGKRLESVSIENSILTGMYDDQVNLLILKLQDLEKGIKFTARKKKEIINLAGLAGD